MHGAFCAMHDVTSIDEISGKTAMKHRCGAERDTQLSKNANSGNHPQPILGGKRCGYQ